MRHALLPLLLLAALTTSACDDAQFEADNPSAAQADESTATVVRTSDVEWEKLNPARGDKSPQAGTLWGDRNGTEATGFLVKFVDGFRSPPHIHNVSYRALVIRGFIHNDDPDAEDMWMKAGSFWTQPKGDVHITAAKGGDNMGYVEIDEGPYLVLPPEEAFDSGEASLNLDASNVVWLDASNVTWVEPVGASAAEDGPKIAFLWGDPEGDRPNGTLLKLPAGFSGELRSRGATLRAVVVQGRLEHSSPSETDAKALEPGSFFSSREASVHRLTCEAGAECILYVRMEGRFDVVSEQVEK